MSHRYAVPKDEYGKKRYESDLDAMEWAIIAPHVAQKDGPGKKRTVNIREVLNAIFYRVRTGCQWRMLPKDFPKWRSVHAYFQIWSERVDDQPSLLEQALKKIGRRNAC